MLLSIPTEYESFSNRSIQSTNRILTNSTTLDLNGSVSNDDKVVLHTFQIS